MSELAIIMQSKSWWHSEDVKVAETLILKFASHSFSGVRWSHPDPSNVEKGSDHIKPALKKSNCKTLITWVKPINIWDYRSLERLEKIFNNNFNRDHRDKYLIPRNIRRYSCLKYWKFRSDRSPSWFLSCGRIPRILFQIGDSLWIHISDQFIRLNLYLPLNKIRIAHIADISSIQNLSYSATIILPFLQFLIGNRDGPHVILFLFMPFGSLDLNHIFLLLCL
jgi:hypothetical protein